MEEQRETNTTEQGQKTAAPALKQKKRVNLVKTLFITFLLTVIIASIIFVYRPFKQQQAPDQAGQFAPTLTPTSTITPTAKPTVSAEVSEFYEESNVDTADSESSADSIENSFGDAENSGLDEPQDFDLEL
ncbi:hypothetical protein KJ596_03405 [Patescibacteria group bacterium]|nr:hypothetical protein [Patescibacteria group bacterium]MBU1867933.1 hypothetical protein [Patescibacteria group bacterium]